jgi:hypothetical protein
MTHCPKIMATSTDTLASSPRTAEVSNDDKHGDNLSAADHQKIEKESQSIHAEEKQHETLDSIAVAQTVPALTTPPHPALSSSTQDKSKDYSSVTLWEKRFIVFTATIAALFSPFTAQIYFPALNTIAQDLRVTNSKVNLTVTTYMVCLLCTSMLRHNS